MFKKSTLSVKINPSDNSFPKLHIGYEKLDIEQAGKNLPKYHVLSSAGKIYRVMAPSLR